MSTHRLKLGYFTLEGLNSFATVYYFYYLYFYMEKVFGWGNRANLGLAALNGAVYMVAAYWGGKFAQRYGYFLALKLGFLVMLLSLAGGWALGARSALGQILVMCLAIVGMCTTWPTLEALVSEGEDRAGLQHNVGLYNVVWAATNALAYFSGGAMMDHLGLSSLFFVPLVIVALQLGLTLVLEAGARRSAACLASLEASAPAVPAAIPVPDAGDLHRGRARMFLQMSWLANPFAYIAINTLVAVMPGVAGRLGLSTMLAGFCCSIWCFARLAAFIGLWSWNAWHYRFRWLLAAFVGLVGTFAAILLVSNLWLLILAQVIFGVALGLIYYSSLFYSMDASDTKSEHGGIHEAAIGFGNFAGPAVGAASLMLAPQYPHGGVLAVSALLLLGLGGLVAIRWRGHADGA